MLAKVLTHALLLLCHPRTSEAPPNPKGWIPKQSSDGFPDSHDGVDDYVEVFDPNDSVYVSRQREALHAWNQQRIANIANNCPPVPDAQGDAGSTSGKTGPKKSPPSLHDSAVLI